MLLHKIKGQYLLVGRINVRKGADEAKGAEAEGGEGVRWSKRERDVEAGRGGKMERREGGNVILQFILEELLPLLPDSDQLPQDGDAGT